CFGEHPAVSAAGSCPPTHSDWLEIQSDWIVSWQTGGRAEAARCDRTGLGQCGGAQSEANGATTSTGPDAGGQPQTRTKWTVRTSEQWQTDRFEAADHLTGQHPPRRKTPQIAP